MIFFKSTSKFTLKIWNQGASAANLCDVQLNDANIASIVQQAGNLKKESGKDDHTCLMYALGNALLETTDAVNVVKSFNIVSNMVPDHITVPENFPNYIIGNRDKNGNGKSQF